MLSIIIPTLNAERHMARTLTALVPAAVEGIVTEVIVVDGGSTDRTLKIADEAGCEIIASEKGRGVQLARGGVAARNDWLLFLHADTELAPGWADHLISFTERQGRERAGYFRFRLDEAGLRPRILEALVRLRCALFALPYGDQGLFIHRTLYDALGGFESRALMEDVALVRKIGRKRLYPIPHDAFTSAEKYREGGFFRRGVRNLYCLSLYFLRVPDERIAAIYNR